ncbi:hypothetical protein JL721_1323 [Aureococcus anophagefferens]|nr:hypothetical protein JL721_1323 [Aureococcus anophagefferens]
MRQRTQLDYLEGGSPHGMLDDGKKYDKRRRRPWQVCGGVVAAFVVAYLIFFHALGPSGRELKRLEKTKRKADKPVKHVEPPPSKWDHHHHHGAVQPLAESAVDVLGRRLAAMTREDARQQLVDAPESPLADSPRDRYRTNDFCDAPPARPKNGVRVVSLNVWQPAADTWATRRAALAALLKGAAPDVVALQELAAELDAAGYAMPHAAYVPGTGDHGIGGRAPDGWTEEGVAVLSRLPLNDFYAETCAMPPLARSSDRNPRTALGVVAETPLGEPLRVVATHLSYDRLQQCSSVQERLRPWLDDLWAGYDDDKENTLGQVVVGDLNTYPDYEWPTDALTLSAPVAAAVGGPCDEDHATREKNVAALAADVGRRAEPAPKPRAEPDFSTRGRRPAAHEAGFTFPNPETMDLDPARPDRVLVRSTKLRADRAWVLGCDEVPGAKGHRPSDHRVLVVDLVPV